VHVASSSGHHSASTGAWVAVLVIVAAFTIGLFALILDSIPLWIATGVAFVVGGILSVTSKLMEQAGTDGH
jgi:hypothetical protein